jgi:hypothetical protein
MFVGFGIVQDAGRIDPFFKGTGLGIDPIFYKGSLDVRERGENAVKRYTNRFVVSVQQTVTSEFVPECVRSGAIPVEDGGRDSFQTVGRWSPARCGGV